MHTLMSLIKSDGPRYTSAPVRRLQVVFPRRLTSLFLDRSYGDNFADSRFVSPVRSLQPSVLVSSRKLHRRTSAMLYGDSCAADRPANKQRDMPTI